MALDRFVYWQNPSRIPSADQVGNVLRDYLGNFAVSVRWEGGRWLAMLRGPTSPMLRSEPGAPWTDEPRERWIEVYVSMDTDPYIDVITRSMDEATNALADGFAKRCAAWWDGKLEDA